GGGVRRPQGDRPGGEVRPDRGGARLYHRPCPGPHAAPVQLTGFCDTDTRAVRLYLCTAPWHGGAMTTSFVILLAVSVWAGIQNALAGGGPFLTLPALMLTDMTALAANITSTVALFPGQVASSWGGRAHVAGAGGLSFKALMVISFVGGIV